MDDLEGKLTGRPSLSACTENLPIQPITRFGLLLVSKKKRFGLLLAFLPVSSSSFLSKKKKKRKGSNSSPHRRRQAANATAHRAPARRFQLHCGQLLRDSAPSLQGRQGKCWSPTQPNAGAPPAAGPGREAGATVQLLGASARRWVVFLFAPSLHMFVGAALHLHLAGIWLGWRFWICSFCWSGQ